jgi:hypothetical protein
MLFIASSICLGSIIVGADMICKSNVETWLPYYPNAEVVSIEHDFIRARAMGETWVVLSSPDDPETVRQFYRDNTLALMRAETLRGWAITDWRVEADPDGEGSIIRLYSLCGE